MVPLNDPRQWPLTLDAVVFDADGVLLDSTENMRSALDVTWRAAGRTGDVPFSRFVAGVGAPLRDLLESIGVPADLENCYVHESRRLAHLLRPFPGVHDLLHELLARGVHTAVATGKSHQRAVEALTVTGLVDLVEVVVGSDLVEHPKPAPDAVLLALSQLGALHGCEPDPRRTAFVGDGELDMTCGHAAGVVVVAAGWGQTPPARLLAHGPHHYAEDVAELVDLLVPSKTPAADLGVPRR